MDEYIYIAIENKYNSFCKEKNKDVIFPSYWYKIPDYKLKSEILFEAMKYNICIENTKKYKILSDRFKNIIIN